MTLTKTRTDVAQPYRPQEHTPRLRLKRTVSMAGNVDGTWPHSADVPAEVPDLMAVSSVQLGCISRVMYSLDERANIAAKLTAVGHAVRLVRIPTPADKHHRGIGARPQPNCLTGGACGYRPRTTAPPSTSHPRPMRERQTSTVRQPLRSSAGNQRGSHLIGGPTKHASVAHPASKEVLVTMTRSCPDSKGSNSIRADRVMVAVRRLFAYDHRPSQGHR